MAVDSRYTGTIGGALQGAATGSAFGAPGAVIGGALGAIGGLLSSGGEDDAKKMAEEQARLIEMQTREEQRRKLRMVQEQVGLARAATFASNLQDTGSTRMYRQSLEAEYRRELAYDRFAGKKRAELAREAGADIAAGISSQGISSLISGATSFGTTYASGGFNYGPTANDLQPVTVTAKRWGT